MMQLTNSRYESALGLADKPELRNNDLPSISIVMPTLNSDKFLDQCLSSIDEQSYPKDLLEIIIVDGGSTDKTLELAKTFSVHKILKNTLKTAEAGKALGIKNSKNELIFLMDSDNILEDVDSLIKLVNPLVCNDKIVASEPLYYTFRTSDPILTRYCALIGMNDPFCLFLGNYDRYCEITKKWTGLNLDEIDRGDYIEFEIKKTALPTIGANGFLFYKKILPSISDYFFDIDLLAKIADQNFKAAKVKIGIIHLYGTDLKDLKRKQKRRIRDFFFFQKQGTRSYPWLKHRKLGLLKFITYTITIIPLIVQMIKGYKQFPDSSWKLHLPACWITLFVYCGGVFQKYKKSEDYVMATRE